MNLKHLSDSGISLRLLEENIILGQKSKLSYSELLEIICHFYDRREWMRRDARKEARKKLGFSERPNLLSPADTQKILKEYDKGVHIVVYLCRVYGISRNTFYRYLNAREEQ